MGNISLESLLRNAIYYYMSKKGIKLLKKSVSVDGSVKYLWQFHDGAMAESVFFQHTNVNGTKIRLVCISSQIGCNIGCAFCAVRKIKLKRNLTKEELYSQVYEIKKDNDIRTNSLHVTFQGTGEPLLNYDNVIQAAEMMLDDKVAEYISLSTSGIPKYMTKLANTRIKELFISLHATEDQTRSRLVPSNRAFNIEKLLSLAKKHALKTGIPVTASYLLLKDINDTDEDLVRLKQLLDPKYFNIQLACLNHVDGVEFKSSNRHNYFLNELKKAGFTTYIIASKGQDVNAGCGQMVSRYQT